MTPRARRRHRRRRSHKAKPIMLGLAVIAALIALVVLSFGIYVLSVAASAPALSDLAPIDEGTNSAIYAADGSRLGYIQSDTARQPVKLDKIPKLLQQGTIAIEDRNYYKHGGIDYNGIARAAWEDLKAGHAVQGGSTITQQLVRNLYIVDPKRDLARKIKEAKLAEDMENAHSKDWILEQYLNTASYGTVEGRTAVGVEAAARTFFSKSVDKLNLEEMALLAGLPQSPTDYNPFLNPQAALERRNEVLDAMARQGYITHAEAREAKSAELDLRQGTRYTRIKEPYFFDFVQQQLIDEYGVATVRKGGLRVHTTLQPRLQNLGRKSIDDHLGYPGDPSAAVVSIDPRTGYVLAMASSGSYKHAQYNLAAQGHRQPGSAFKAFVLATALKEGVNPYSTYYVSKHLDLQLPEYGHWVVDTAEKSESNAPVSIASATTASDNTVFAQLDLDLGPKAVRQTAYDMGITTKLDGLPAEGLGGLRLGVSPLEMADAYATLANGGIHTKPKAIKEVQFPDGHTDDIGKPERNRALPENVAYEVTKILHTVITSGTGTNANVGCQWDAGKTGTTTHFSDAWFVGYRPRASTAVWVGYPDALHPMTSVHGQEGFGGTLAAPIWNSFMAGSGIPCTGYKTPSTPISYTPFYGQFTANRGAAPTTPYSSQSQDSGAQQGGGYNGYDPRAYAPGIQQGGPPGQQKKPGN
jgi:penicillin-binding protein 1A